MKIRKALLFGALLLTFSCKESPQPDHSVYSLQASEPKPFLRAPEPEVSTTIETTTTTVVATTTSTVPPEAPRIASPASEGYSWDALAECETGVSPANWATNTGNGYSGGLQFHWKTWKNYGGTGEAWQHSRETQIAIAERVLAAEGWNAWPACSQELGYQ